MATRRMGQILGEIASLNAHDLEEVLQEQKVTHQRFGETALSLGLVQPQQVWHAWLEQLRSGNVKIDLKTIGVDSQAAQFLLAADARRLQVVAIRSIGNDLILAAAAPPDEACLSFLTARTGKQLAFGIADPAAIEAAIARSYSAAKPAAASDAGSARVSTVAA